MPKITMARILRGRSPEVVMRARERYAVEGPEAADDTELLALVIGTAAAGLAPSEIARALLAGFGGLRGVADAPVAALCTVAGVGPARAVRISAGLQAGLRAGRHRPAEPPTIGRPSDVWTLLGGELSSLAVEELHGLYLDRRGGLLTRRRLSRGNDQFTIVDPRIVFRAAVQAGAASVIVAHNHPSGDPTPSDADRDVTRRLADAGRLLGIPLLDHVVIASGGHVSLAELGALPTWTPVPPPTNRG